MGHKILIYGFYNKGNLGDQFFIDAFKELFPNDELYFTDIITKELLIDRSAVFFGGGSFLLEKPEINDDCLPILNKKKIFYIGIGVEKNIHPIHLDLIKKAKLIATRSKDQIERVKQLNNNTIYIPDIVYALYNRVPFRKSLDKSILVIPNSLVVPKWNDPQWQHASWNYFKSEYSQFIDCLIAENYKVNFLSMCSNKFANDLGAIYEIINQLENKNKVNIIENITDFDKIIDNILLHDTVISQRYHGIILSELTKTPYIAIYHHDKIKNCYPANGKFLSYYGINKDDLLDNFFNLNSEKYSDILPIDPNVFEMLKKEVSKHLEGD